MAKCSYCGRENEHAQSACYECGAELSASPCASVPASSRRAVWLALGLLVISFALYTCWVASRPTKFDQVPIQGTREFRDHVVAALTLLKAKSPQAYEMVTNYIGVFAQSRHTGMAAYEEPPTSYLHDKPAWESVEAFAADIAHESFHSKLYHDFLRTNAWATVQAGAHTIVSVPEESWGGEAGEKLCCEYQVRILTELGASVSEIAAAAWDPSNRYWEVPYEKRDW